ncbi:FimB/Mfa2 family fimbrial subunit [Bacteroides sp.]|uniref:FimB/Mfa2 family fimbrial subunit n=1 Tax=Bacteroides sp. TaxID=29523 RepID=UPI0026377EB0|nr:FimB/Mfa2 family fimbrial subunit [Bacteroides sp.]MDD3040211.1 FimB/Mfa2 family fimbrial subunit [Bacteroides sp.]
MKNIIFMAILTAAIFAGCSSDNPMLPEDDCGNVGNSGGNNSGLISPDINATVNSPDNSQSPMTGVLEVYPCQAGTSFYYGNYINDVLTPFPGFYYLKDGSTFEAPKRALSLPIGTYNMIYWGTPKYEEPIYSNSTVSDPQLTVGGDLSQQYLGLRQNFPDTTYYPVFDLVYAVKPANIGTEELNAAMKRQVAGLKVIVKNKNNGILSSSIASMKVHIGGIAEKINLYTAAVTNQTKTVAFPLVLSIDGTQMSNATVMLFPSSISPLFQLIVTLKNGTVKIFKQPLSSPLKANTRLTLTLTLSEIFSEEDAGNFTIDNWQEESETIDIPSFD